MKNTKGAWPQPPQPEAAVFEADAGSVMQDVREALARLIGAIPGKAPVRKAADLERALGIRKTMAWQMFSVAHSDDPLTEASKIPGREARAKFLQAAASSGVAEADIRAVENAFESFEDLVTDHSGDRESFLSMASGVTDQRDGQVDLQYKRAAFRANSHFLGHQARSSFGTVFIKPVKGDRMDLAVIRGFVDARRLRASARLVGFNCSVGPSPHDSAPKPYQVEYEPIDSDVDAPDGIALLRDFCSQPLPTIRRTTINKTGSRYTEFSAPGIGRLSTVTCICGYVIRNVPSLYLEEQPVFARSQDVRIPLESIVLDVLVEHGFFPRKLPQITVHSGLRTPDLPLLDSETTLLPLDEKVVYLGTGPGVLHTPDVPRYPEMARYVLRTLKWDGVEFDVYRCRVRYPILPSIITMRFEPPKNWPNQRSTQDPSATSKR